MHEVPKSESKLEVQLKLRSFQLSWKCPFQFPDFLEILKLQWGFSNFSETVQLQKIFQFSEKLSNCSIFPTRFFQTETFQFETFQLLDFQLPLYYAQPLSTSGTLNSNVQNLYLEPRGSIFQPLLLFNDERDRKYEFSVDHKNLNSEARNTRWGYQVWVT